MKDASVLEILPHNEKIPCGATAAERPRHYATVSLRRAAGGSALAGV
jgi:hypothetical protein